MSFSTAQTHNEQTKKKSKINTMMEFCPLGQEQERDNVVFRLVNQSVALNQLRLM